MASASAPSAGVGPNPTTPEYRNWLSLGHALTTVLCEGLRPFIKRETEAFYNNVKAAVAAILAGPCTCVHVPGRRPSEFHDMKTCTWANTIQLHHRKRRPNWKQSDSSKWLDPILGPWEIAMLFLPDLGGHAPIQGPEDMDVTGILNLMYWCDHFTVQQALIKDVRDARNEKWVHVPKLELSDADKKDAFDAIEKLLVLGSKFDQQKLSLGLFADGNGVYRCRGRLENSTLPYKAKYPALVPAKNHLSSLIVQECHERVKHRGIKDTLTELRSRYWIIKGRQVVKNHLRNCALCSKNTGETIQSSCCPEPTRV